MSRKNILIVDTNRDFLRNMRDWLRPLSGRYQAAFSGNTSKAEDMLKKFSVHLVIANIHLSGESGIELLLNIRRWHSGTHVVLYGENLSEQLRRATYHSGAAAILEYPFPKEEFLKCLESIFDEEPDNTFLDSIPLSDLLQLHGMGEGSSNIVVTAGDGRRGIIRLSGGILVEAEMGGKFGTAAIAEMLSWQSPSIRSSAEKASEEPVSGESVMQVLLQAATMIDEKSEL